MDFRVSVIIPVHNATKFIERAVESASSIECVKEIILVEDGFDDESFFLCERITTKNNKAKLFTHPGKINLGAGASRNLGLRNVTMPFVAFLDADDFYLPNRFETTIKKFMDAEIYGVYEALGTHYYNEEIKEKYLTAGNKELTTLNRPITGGFLLFKAILTEKNQGIFTLDALTIRNKNLIYFNEELKQCQDTDYINRSILKYTFTAGNITSPVAMRGVHNENRILKNIDEKRISFEDYIDIWYNLVIDKGFGREINQKFIKDKISLTMNYNQPLFKIKINLIISFTKLFLTNPIVLYRFFF